MEIVKGLSFQLLRWRLIGQKAIVGYGTDTDLMVDGGAKVGDLEKAALFIQKVLGGGTLEWMKGPYVPGGEDRDRFRVVSNNGEIDVIVVTPDEFDYVSEAYDRASAQRDRYEELRRSKGKIEAYNAFGIALTPRNWRQVF